ncbi:MAG TPA: hypothetical protein VNI53_01895 [Gammaproteobacteria bacterium]|nr:hypothetical protein [Gammaproteobacteria bacterium]
MNVMMRKSNVWLIGLLLASLCAATMASPFVNSRSVPHAVLYLNYKLIPQKIWPVRIWMVDGKLTNRSDQQVIWIQPGKYSFDVKLTKVVNLAYMPGLMQKIPNAQQMHEMKLRVEAGKAYYIGAKFAASGKWQPEVWKTEKAKY